MSISMETAALLIFALCLKFAWPQDDPLPSWKSLLVRYPSWAGYLEDSNSRYISSMRTLSVQRDKDGLAYVAFTSQHFTIDMNVYSEDNETVFFKEDLNWAKESHFKGHTNIEFKGRFVLDEIGYFYKYEASVSSSEEKDFANLTLLPEEREKRHKKRSSANAGLYIGIPIALAIIVISLGGLVLYWGFRKGYLRHVPWSYKAFSNRDASKKDVGIDMHRDQPAAEEPTVHI